MARAILTDGRVAVASGLAALLLMLTLAAAGQAQQRRTYDDPVAELDRKLAAGEATIEYSEAPLGYLRDLLQKLDINADSQILVFSKTSFQQELITPETPRAIYFNDDTSVGYVVHGTVFEITTLDSQEGVQYYVLDQPRTEKPRFGREFVICASCHGPVNRYAQGIMVASSYTAPDGTPYFLGGNELFHVTDHRSPFEERWGGWYVTGTHGKMTHRGNAIAPDPFRPYELNSEGAMNVTSLEGRFDTSQYPVPTSDLIALMTFEHQSVMTNMITSLAAQQKYSGNYNIPEASRPTKEQIDVVLEDMVAYMVFANEAELTDPVKGVSTFTATFPQRGPADSKGRSLRDFNLQTRLFEYPLSYMIYSRIFNGMPLALKDRVLRRVYDVLSGADNSERFARLSPERRRAALEIVAETYPNLPEYWKVP